MRGSHISPNSIRKQEAISKSRSRSKSQNSVQAVENKFYFCHYKNAMYMGGMKSFTKNGTGIILHDNGASVVCSHYNDFKHGHHVIYQENCLMSIIYEKNKISEAAVRMQNYMIYLRYNKDGQIDGKGVLLDYSKRIITYLTYRKNSLINKRDETEFAVTNKVFDLGNVQFLIGVLHSKALRHQLTQFENIGFVKSGTKLNIGFCKRGLINGLGFSMNIKQHNDNKLSDNFVVKSLERGYFQNSQITGMGEKWFKNGNFYVGDFKDGIFEGKGVLKNCEKNNWVHGVFCKGNMTELIEYSHQGDLAKFNRLVQLMHQRKSSWINKQIIIESAELFRKQIQKILNNKPIANMKSLQQKKQEVLRKIQQNFICDDAHATVPYPLEGKYASEEQIHVDDGQENKQGFNTVSDKIDENSYNSPQRVKDAKPQQTTEARSIYNIKILDTRKGNNPTSEKKISSTSPNLRDSREVNRMKFSQKSMGFSQIKDQEPSLKLDSKRVVGRSRLFKYSINEEDQEPPTFNYTRTKV